VLKTGAAQVLVTCLPGFGFDLDDWLQAGAFEAGSGSLDVTTPISATVVQVDINGPVAVGNTWRQLVANFGMPGQSGLVT
jgi:hypothetical protein